MAPLKIKPAVKHGKPVWLVDMRGSKGGRRFFAVKADAQRFANGKQAEIFEMGTGAHLLTAEERAEFVTAKRQLGDAGTILQAVDFFLAHHSVKSPMGMAMAVELCVMEKQASGRRPAYIKKLNAVLGRLAKALPKNCHLFTRDDVEGFLRGTGWTLGTKKYALQDLRTFFAFCIGKGWALKNPCDGIASFTPEDKPPGILTADEAGRLMTTAAKSFPGLVGYLALALFAGIRPNELMRLDWVNVDVARAFVEVPSKASKTRQRRITKLEPNALAWLEGCSRTGSIAPVNWRRLFRACRVAAGVPWSHDVLRHSFASYHLAMFGSADKTATEMGHYNTQMLFRHYRELVRPEDAERFWKIFPKDPQKSTG